MKRMIAALLALALLTVLRPGAAAAEGTGFPGSFLPELTADTEGEAFVLPEAPAEIPGEIPTRAFPVSGKRAVRADGGEIRRIHMYADGRDEPLVCYVVPEDMARIRLEISEADDPAAMIYADISGRFVPVAALLDPAQNAYVCGQPAAGSVSGRTVHYNCGILADGTLYPSDPESVLVFLIRDPAYSGEIEQDLAASGRQGFRWEYAEDGETAESTPEADIIHAMDQFNDPVPEVCVSFCTDTACIMV